MKKFLIYTITLIGFVSFLSCNKQIASYQFLGFDNTNNTAYIAVSNETEQQVWINTAYYVLDSMNIVLNKKNKGIKLQMLALVSYGLEKENNTVDSNIIGTFKYIFDTKEQTIIFKGNEVK